MSSFLTTVVKTCRNLKLNVKLGEKKKKKTYVEVRNFENNEIICKKFSIEDNKEKFEKYKKDYKKAIISYDKMIIYV